VVASLYVGNVMLLILNLPLIGLWVKILKVPYHFLFSLILLFCVIGSYVTNNNPYDVIIMVIFGLIGYAMKKLDYEAAPPSISLGPGTHDGECSSSFPRPFRRTDSNLFHTAHPGDIPDRGSCDSPLTSFLEKEEIETGVTCRRLGFIIQTIEGGAL